MSAVERSPEPPQIKSTLLGSELTAKQDVWVNYLLPTLGACLLFVLHFAADLVLTYRHFVEENPIWASLTLFFMYLPVLGCFVITISSWELWPKYEGCGWTNIKWALLKILQHVFFPVWTMWRYAERVFWSIEALRSEEEESRRQCLKTVTAARTIELYFFLQGYLHCIPQILLQLHILVRNVNDMNKQTVDVQLLSLITNLCKISITTTLFQRFKSQKIAGKQYPWLKPYKLPFDRSIQTATLKQTTSFLPVPTEEPSTSRLQERRRSSDIYMEPSGDDVVPVVRETSILDGPERVVFREPDDPDFFNITRLREIKGLPEDDAAGKMMAFFWWFCFLIARMVAISTFAYFYPTDIIWLLSAHFILVVALLLYDVRADEVRRAKAIFFIFIGLVYLFCLIEFKIKFKKTKFIYNGFFILVFGENIVMCLIWWFGNLETIENDWWFRYTFILFWGCTVLSIITMLFYMKINKPKKIVAARVPDLGDQKRSTIFG